MSILVEFFISFLAIYYTLAISQVQSKNAFPLLIHLAFACFTLPSIELSSTKKAEHLALCLESTSGALEVAEPFWIEALVNYGL